MTSHRYDVVVVGAGAMGSAAALALARAGRHVLVLEQHSLGHDRGGSHGGSRLFRLDYSSEARLAMACRAERLWHELEAETGESFLTHVGAIEHGMSAARVEAAVGWSTAAGVAVEELPAASAAERWPHLTFEGTVLHQPAAGRLDPDTALSAVRRLAAEAGAEFRASHPVEKLTVTETGEGRRGDDGRVVVDTAGATIVADQLVAAVGGWAPRLLDGLVSLPPITVTQEQPRFFTPLSDASDWPVFVHWRNDAGPYGAEAGYGCYEPGVGFKVGLHRSGPVIDPDEPVELDDELAKAVVTYAERWFPGVDPTGSTPLSCLYDNSPDSEFVIDRVGPISYATGFSGEGFKFVPVVGELLRDLAVGPRRVRSGEVRRRDSGSVR